MGQATGDRRNSTDVGADVTIRWPTPPQRMGMGMGQSQGSVVFVVCKTICFCPLCEAVRKFSQFRNGYWKRSQPANWRQILTLPVPECKSFNGVKRSHTGISA